ncbi:nucleoside phosphorylase [Thermoproteota archaeon]
MAVKESELVIIDGKIYHLGMEPKELAKQVFVVGDPKRADLVADHFDSIDYRIQNREYVTRTGKYEKDITIIGGDSEGMPATVIATGIGTDNNEIAVVEMYGLNEFDFETRERKEQSDPLTIIRIGTSGGPQEDIEPGTLAISEYAIGLDSTGLFIDEEVPDETAFRMETEAYEIITDATPDQRRFKGKIWPYASKADIGVFNALKNHAKGDSATGITLTSSSFFSGQGREIPGIRNTIPNLQEWIATIDVDGRKVVNIEMESSLLFHLARHIGYRCGTVCAIIANRPAGTFLEDYGPAVERGIQTGLDAMLELYNKK